MLANLTPSMLISYLLVLMTAFSVHEFAHAYTANAFGDLTPAMNGRLTLNPLAHLDVMGSVMLLVAGFGWAKPVPINPYVLERRSRFAPFWVSLAGPLSNLVMAVIVAIPFKVGLVSASAAFSDYLTAGKHILPTLPQFMLVFVQTNLLLMLFNLIPLAPLDGEKVLYYLLPPGGQRVMDQIRPYGPFLLLFLILMGSFMKFDLLGTVISPAMNFMLKLLIL
jgi:Zn-dependent protease